MDPHRAVAHGSFRRKNLKLTKTWLISLVGMPRARRTMIIKCSSFPFISGLSSRASSVSYTNGRSSFLFGSPTHGTMSTSTVPTRLRHQSRRRASRSRDGARGARRRQGCPPHTPSVEVDYGRRLRLLDQIVCRVEVRERDAHELRARQRACESSARGPPASLAPDAREGRKTGLRRASNRQRNRAAGPRRRIGSTCCA